MMSQAMPKLRLSTLVLIAIGLFDLATTLMLLHLGMKEGNPFFSRFAMAGPVPLIATKVAFLAGPIALLEIARKHAPKSAEQGTWIAAACYLALYGSHLISYLR